MWFSSNGWMNDSLTIDYLRTLIGALSFNKCLLVWDAYCCHRSGAVRAETARLQLQTAIVPGGCTKFIQAADVVWNACFKSHLRSHYDTWLAEPAGHQYTKEGNLKPPSCSLLCEWVKSCWEAVPSQMVKESFTFCAITTSISGSEDEKIHCFKPGQPCEEGRSVLAKEMNTLFAHSNQDSDEESFSSDEDDEETENNEACIDEDDEENDEDADDQVESSTEDDLSP